MAAPASNKSTIGPTELLILGVLLGGTLRYRTLLWQLAWQELTTRVPAVVVIGQYPRTSTILAGGVLVLVLYLVFAAISAISRKRKGAGTNNTHRTEDAGVLATKPPPVMSWAVPNVAGRGVLTLLSAPPGLGKGWWLWALIRAMQEGSRFFGLPVTRQRVLWCTEEGTSFASTARRFGIKPGLVQVLRRDQLDVIEWPALVATIRRLAWKHKCPLVVIDTVRAWCPPETERTPAAANEVMNLVRRELTKPGLGVLFVHHDRKGGGEYGEGVAGTNALVGAVDILVELKRVQGQERARRMLTSRRFEPLDVTATLEDGAYVVPPSEVPGVPVVDAATLQDVPAYLQSTLDALPAAPLEGVTADAVQTATGVSRQTASNRLTALLDLGLVERDGSGTKVAPYRWRGSSNGHTGVWQKDEPLSYPPGFDDDAYRKSAHWRQVCREAKARAQGVCEVCEQAQAVDVHHRHYRNLGAERPEDVVALCLACHARANAEQRRAHAS